MKAIIMAGGFAKRLYPLTKNKSKCLLKIAERPIIDYTIDKLKEIRELEEIIVITNELFYEDFINWARTNPLSIRILSDGGTSEDSKIGALTAFLNFLSREKLEEDFFLAGADNFFKFSLKKIYQIFKKENKNLAVFYDIKNLEDAKRFGVALLEKNLIVDFEEKPENPKSTIVSSAMYFIKKETLPLIQELNKEVMRRDDLGELMEYLYKRTPLYAVVAEENMDIGTIELLKKAEKEVLKSKKSFY
jgi:glucose-1-phosphate thymidylyltransferase